MKYFISILLIICSYAVFAEAYSIPKENVNKQKIFWGDSSSFETPAEVWYDKVVKETPEYKAISKDNVESGTAKYWILVSKANDHAIRLIINLGKETDYDFIADKDYLSELDTPIKCDDVTKIIIEKIE